MDYSAYTVVNRYENDNDLKKPVYAKFQCMHCLYPACVSACIVGPFPGKQTELLSMMHGSVSAISLTIRKRQ